MSETLELRKLYIPSGAEGPRKCIAIHPARMVMRVILAALFPHFELNVVNEIQEQDVA